MAWRKGHATRDRRLVREEDDAARAEHARLPVFGAQVMVSYESAVKAAVVGIWSAISAALCIARQLSGSRIRSAAGPDPAKRPGPRPPA
ncbi:putative pilin transmembrane protein [Ralstonia solanacearum CMR15]|nr:putative pilin transmembrane protein [Ralstonia solanacearum CMR15]